MTFFFCSLFFMHCSIFKNIIYSLSKKYGAEWEVKPLYEIITTTSELIQCVFADLLH